MHSSDDPVGADPKLLERRRRHHRSSHAALRPLAPAESPDETHVVDQVACNVVDRDHVGRVGGASGPDDTFLVMTYSATRMRVVMSARRFGELSKRSS